MTSHQVQSVLETKGHQWMTGGRLTEYQAMLLDTPEVTLKTCQTRTPATLMPGPDHRASIECKCSEITDLVHSSRPDLNDSPNKNADDDWFTDGSSFMDKGEKKAGYATVSLMKTIEAKPLPVNTSAPKAEIIAPLRALQLAKGLKINIYIYINIFWHYMLAELFGRRGDYYQVITLQ